MPLQFGWDERKRRSNLRKHGVDFLDVTRMFENHVAETIDDREDYGEERIIAIGRVGVEGKQPAFVAGWRFQIGAGHHDPQARVLPEQGPEGPEPGIEPSRLGGVAGDLVDVDELEVRPVPAGAERQAQASRKGL